MPVVPQEPNVSDNQNLNPATDTNPSSASDNVLTFKTSEEQANALKAIQDRGATLKDLDEIERIGNAKVLEPDTTDNPGELENATNQQEQTVKQEPTNDSASANASSTASETAAEFARNWQIKEEDIPKDSFYDSTTRRNRPFITHKTPKDLFQSYIKAQKNNHYLKEVLLPQERAAAVDTVRKEYEEKLRAASDEIAKLKTVQPPAATATAQQFTQTQQSANPIVPETAITDLAGVLKELDEIDPDTSLENSGMNTQKLKKALVASFGIINGLNQKVHEINKSNQESAAERAQREQLDKVKQERTEKEQAVSRLYSEIDTFSQSDDLKKILPDLVPSRPYKDMLGDAMNFQKQVASVYYNKPASALNVDEVENAMAEYLRKTPALIQAIETNGIEEPNDFRQFIFIDQLDAMRTGLHRNPETHQWEQRLDSVTKKPVMLGDFKTALNHYLEITGKKDEINRKAKIQGGKEVIAAINRRDNGITQLDVTKNGGDESPMSPDDAVRFIKSIDPDMVISEYKRGNKENFNKMNAALVSIGGEPLAPPA